MRSSGTRKDGNCTLFIKDVSEAFQKTPRLCRDDHIVFRPARRA